MGLNQARNDNELKQMLKLPLKYAVRILMEKILEANTDAINKVVYYNEMGTPKYYKNTYEFLEAWDVAVHATKAIKTADIQGSFFYKPSEMETSAPPSPDNNYMGQHYGIDEEWGDSRKYLADIIYQGLSGDIFGVGPWTKKRNAYEELVKYIGKARFKKWFAESMEDVGLTVKTHGKAIKRTKF